MAQELEALTPLWQKEDIPSTAYLFRYIHKSQLNKSEKKPIPKAMDGGYETSCDWDKYSSPEQSRALLASQKKMNKDEFKNPEDYFIIKLLVQNIIEKIPSQKVEHAPIQNDPVLPDNRSHSHIVGEKEDVEVRLKFIDICDWAIAPPDSC